LPFSAIRQLSKYIEIRIVYHSPKSNVKNCGFAQTQNEKTSNPYEAFHPEHWDYPAHLTPQPDSIMFNPRVNLPLIGMHCEYTL